MPGVMVGIYGPAHPLTSAWVQMTTTRADGTYLLRVPAGKQYVYIMSEGRGDSGEHVSVTEGHSTEVDFHVK